MFFTTVSPKYQLTLGSETRQALGIEPGTRLKQTVEDGRVILEPIGDILTSYGVFKRYSKGASIEDETQAAERAMAEDAMNSMRDV